MGEKKTYKLQEKGFVYAAYQAIMTRPSEKFTCQEIFDEIKDHPKANLNTLIKTISYKFKEMGIIENTGQKVGPPIRGKQVSIYRRLPEDKQPTVRATKAGRQKKLPPHVKSAQKKFERKRPASEPSSGIIDATQVGESIIDYIKHLEKKVHSLAGNLKSTLGNHKTEIQRLQKQIDVLRYEKNGLENQIDNLLKEKNKDKVKTLDISKIHHHQQQRVNNGCQP